MRKVIVAACFSVFTILAFGWDSSSYKQEGRVAQWDGLENAGRSRHDASASVWKDLSGHYDLTLTENGSWGSSWLVVDGLSATGGPMSVRSGITPCYSVEVVYRMTDSKGGVVFHNSLNGFDRRCFFFSDDGKKLRLWGDLAYRSCLNVKYDEADHVVQSRFEKAEGSKIILDGVVGGFSEKTDVGAGAGYMTVGAQTAENANPWWGRVYAIRLYDHILTEEEITRHRLIDEARFFGKYPANSIYVMADDERCGVPVPGYGCRTDLTVGDEYVFTAPAEHTNVTDGVAATCAGWELYEPGASEPFRTSADPGESPTSCTVVYSSNVRLRWRWTNVRYRVRATVAGGAADKAEQWVDAGASASVTATGPSEQTFVGWSGDSTGLEETLSWPELDGPKTVCGAFMNTDFPDADATFFVAQGGSDANDGTSVAQALATPAAAMARAQAVDGLAVIAVGPGTYAARTTLSFGGKGVRMVGAGRDVVRLDFGWFCRGVYIDHAQARLEGVEIYRGYQPAASAQNGGGARVSAGTLADCRLLSCDVAGGWQYGYGGGVAVSGSGVVSGCEITDCRSVSSYTHGNAADVNGGVLTNCNIFANNGGVSSPTLDNGSAVVYLRNGTVVACRIHDNVKQTCPGVHQLNGTLANCLIYNNVGGSGTSSGYGAGGVYRKNGNMYHCTVWGNVLNLDTTGLSGVVQTGGTARNNVITGNGPSDSTAGSCRITGGTFARNAIDMAQTGYSDNALGDVKFMDAANADFRLSSKASAAYRYGLPIAGQTVDFAGRPRDAEHPSAGVYEYDSSVERFGVDLQLARNDYKAGESVAVDAIVSGADPSDCTLDWAVDGTGLGETGSHVELAELAPGSHVITVTVSTAGRDPVSNSASVKLWPLKTFVGGTGEGVPPYDTPEKATSDLVTAFSALWPAADEVLSIELAGGTYRVRSVLQIARPIQIVGAGKDRTVLDCGNETKCFVVASAGALVKDLTVSNAYARTNGGGISISAGTVDGCRVTDCHCDGAQEDGWDHGFGGGVAVTGGRFVNGEITRCRIDANYNKGNALYVGGTDSVASNCDIYANDGGHAGGEVYNGGGTVYVTGGKLLASRIRDNVKQIAPGIVQKGGLVANCLVYGNSTGPNGIGAAGLDQFAGQALYCTIYGNTNDADTTGLSGVRTDTYQGQQQSCSVKNCIIWRNGPPTCTAGSSNIPHGTFENNVLDVALASYPNNAVGDPKFLDSAAFDFRIATQASFAWRAAAPTASVTTDLAGHARDEEAPTAGAYEYDPELEVYGVSLATELPDAPVGATVRVQAVVSGTQGAAYSLVWTLDGSAVAGLDSETAEFGDLALGRHVVGVTVETVGKGVVSDALAVTVHPYETFVNATGSGTYPYDTPEKATNDVAEAYDAVWKAADATSTVHVAAGEYVTDKTVAMAFPVRVVGAGKELTRVVKTATPGRVFNLTHAQALVSGLTVTGAVNGAFSLSAGLVADCRVEDCLSKGSINGLAYSVSGGRVTGCEAIDCRVNSGAGKGAGFYLSGGVISNCLARQCGLLQYVANYGMGGGGVFCDNGGRVTHCRIENGGATGSGGHDGVALYAQGSAAIDHCTIVGCRARFGSIVLLKGFGVAPTIVYPTIETSLIANSTCDGTSTTAVALFSEGADLLGCTVAANAQPVAVKLTSGSVRNCIFAGNAGTYSLGTAAIDHSCCPALTDGENGNITGDPLFKRPASGNFRLRAGSPCRNKGDPSPFADEPEATDLDGNPRVYRGEIHMGCYQNLIPGLLLMVH